MRFLLDVNVLVAHGLSHHALHARVETWLRSVGSATLLTCSITELGFLRILNTPAVAGVSIPNGRKMLASIKKSDGLFEFLPDPIDGSSLPEWVLTAKQVTDGHLLALAQAHNARLATLDARIPGAFLIPEA